MSLGNPLWLSDIAFRVLEDESAQVVDLSVDVEGQGLYSIVGGLDADLFELDPLTGILAFAEGSPDFEQPTDDNQDNRYVLTVQFSDVLNGMVSRDLEVVVQSQNDQPDLLFGDGDGLLTIAENRAFVVDVASVDSESVEGNGITYAIAGGDDAALFDIDTETGGLTFLAAPDFEAPVDTNQDNLYDLDISVTDGGNFDAESAFPERTVLTYDDHHYLLTEQAQSWSAAQAEAESLGGNLVVIDSEAEQNFLENSFSGAGSIWTNLQDIDGNGVLEHSSGDAIAFSDLGRLPVTYDPAVDSLNSQYRGSSAVILYDLRPNISYFIDTLSTSGYFGVIEIDPDDLRNTVTESLQVQVLNQEANGGDDLVVTPKDTPITIEVLANDSASDGAALTVDTIDGQPLNGDVTINPDQTITYQPDRGFAGGIDQFTYQISDELGEVGSATVTIDVRDRNSAPVALDDVVTTLEDTPLEIDVLGNDTDINGNRLFLREVSEAANGTVEIMDGQLLYRPDSDFNGTDSFTYRIADGKGGQNTAEVTVNVDAVNDAPVAVTDRLSIARDQTIVIDAIANDRDVDGDRIQLDAITQDASQGASFISFGGRLIYDPNVNATGQDIIEYAISDGQGGQDIGQIIINIDNDGGTGNGGGGEIPRVISGQVRQDDDGDGDLSDDDAGIRGVTLELFEDFDGNNRADGAAIASTQTEQNGQFQFDNLQTGTYIVNEIDLEGYSSTGDSNGFNPNRITQVSLGDELVFLDQPETPQRQFTIAGQVREDSDSDGDLADDDVGIAGIELRLYADFDSNNREDGDAIATTTTDDQGFYAFNQREAGNYIVQEVDPNDSMSTRDVNGGNPNRVVGLTVNEATPQALGIDFLDYLGGDTSEPLIGTGQADTLKGSAMADEIYGRAGADKILANGGADEVHGQYGDDTLKGLGGQDTLFGGRGNDLLQGGGGQDILVGQDAATAGANEIDTLVGGQGGDRFILGDENMVFYSQSGENDYALITDFDDGDRLTLQGSSSQYRVQNREGAIALFHRANGANDLIVVLEGRGILDLQGEQVTYQS